MNVDVREKRRRMFGVELGGYNCVKLEKGCVERAHREPCNLPLAKVILGTSS